MGIKNIAGGAALAITLALTQSAPGGIALASTPQASAIGTMKQDLEARSLDIHWPPGFDPASADLFAHNAMLIHAPCSKVFGLIVDAPQWPRWYPNASKVRIVKGGSTLSPDARFQWTTFGLAIDSKVHEYVPDSRIGWYGYVPGQAPAFYHT